MIHVGMFSAGVSSAVAVKLVAGELDAIFYTHIDDQHPDTLRFVWDCHTWFDRDITIRRSPLRTVENAIRQASFVSTPRGTIPCSRLLKARVRKDWEREAGGPFTYYWGLDAAEAGRAEGIERAMPRHEHRFPLLAQNISKQDAHDMLVAAGIKRPAMYELGYHNNNCVGCVRGGMGYWNRIREDFPEVFAARAKLEREIGGSCINGVYLDELEPERGRHQGPIVPDCGLMCERYKQDLNARRKVLNEGGASLAAQCGEDVAFSPSTRRARPYCGGIRRER